MIPEIDAVMTYEAPWMKRAAGIAYELPAQLPEGLSAGAFDSAVIFTCFSQSPLPAALMCSLAGIPLRLAICRENPYGLLTDWVRETEPEQGIRHEVRRQLDLVATVGAKTADERMALRVPGAAHDIMRRQLRGSGIDDAVPWIVLHPGATAPSRRYPPERFAQAARQFIQDHGMQVLITGSGAEFELAATIRAAVGAGAFNLAGQLGLGELAALIEAAQLLVSNNSGPVHIAACVGTPVVDLYALTNPQHTPWQVPSRVLFHDVPCRNCFKSICPQGHHRCLLGVAAGQVAQAAAELLTLRRRPDRAAA
jgi:lipopolysaccharide heptosyltransferase II